MKTLPEISGQKSAVSGQSASRAFLPLLGERAGVRVVSLFLLIAALCPLSLWAATNRTPINNGYLVTNLNANGMKLTNVLDVTDAAGNTLLGGGGGSATNVDVRAGTGLGATTNAGVITITPTNIPATLGGTGATNANLALGSLRAFGVDDFPFEFLDTFNRANTGVGGTVLGTADSGHTWFHLTTGLAWSTNYYLTNGALVFSAGAGLTNGNTNWYSYPCVQLDAKPTKFGMKFDLLLTNAGIFPDNLVFLMSPQTNSLNDAWHISLKNSVLNITYITNGNFITLRSVADPFPGGVALVTNGLFEIVLAGDTIMVNCAGNKYYVTDPVVPANGGKFLAIENIGNQGLYNRFHIKSVYAGQSDSDVWVANSNGIATNLTLVGATLAGNLNAGQHMITNVGAFRANTLSATNGAVAGHSDYGFRFQYGTSSSGGLYYDPPSAFLGSNLWSYTGTMFLWDANGVNAWGIGTNGTWMPAHAGQGIGNSSYPAGTLYTAGGVAFTTPAGQLSSVTNLGLSQTRGAQMSTTNVVDWLTGDIQWITNTASSVTIGFTNWDLSANSTVSNRWSVTLFMSNVNSVITLTNAYPVGVTIPSNGVYAVTAMRAGTNLYLAPVTTDFGSKPF